jgi:putative salt-induced outer membrane protein YdiY
MTLPTFGTTPIRLRSGCVVLTLVIVSCLGAHAKRKDLVIMMNGDHLTGEVKRLENGVLYVDLDYVSGAVGLDWLEVERVQSTANFQVVLKNGTRLVGTIEKKAETETTNKDFEVHSPNGVAELAAPDVVDIKSQKSSFWRQLTGSLDFGYSFASGNSQTQINTDANASYLTTKWTGSAGFTSSFGGQSGGSKTNLFEVQTIDGYFLSRNSFVSGLADFLHSSQQDLALRSTVGGGYGRYLVRTNRTVLSWLGGAVFTNEDFTSAVSNQTQTKNVEALLGAQYQQFRFDRYTWQSQLLLYPGLSDLGRVRLTTKTTFSVKLSNNFHTDFSLWDNFDSRPPSSSKKNELSVSNTLGWTF